MPIAQPTFKPATLTVFGSTTPLITNLSLPTANNEESHSLSSSLKQLQINSRNNGVLKIAFNSGESGMTYITIPSRTTFFINDLSFSGVTLYIQSSINGDVAEILELS